MIKQGQNRWFRSRAQSHRLAHNFSISLSGVVCHLHDLGKSIWSWRIVLYVTKILQNFWLTLVDIYSGFEQTRKMYRKCNPPRKKRNLLLFAFIWITRLTCIVIGTIISWKQCQIHNSVVVNASPDEIKWLQFQKKVKRRVFKQIIKLPNARACDTRCRTTASTIVMVVFFFFY